LVSTIARQSLLAAMRGISKSHLDAFRLEDGAAQRFENPAAGFRAFAKWLGKAPVARIVFEPTIAPLSGMFTCPRGGPYHKAFEATLGETFPLVKVNPLQARRFAEAHGTRAKTDAVPSRQIASCRKHAFGVTQSPAGQWMPGCWPGWGWHSISCLKCRAPRKSLFSGTCTLRVPD